jgi:hypothetical protein
LSVKQQSVGICVVLKRSVTIGNVLSRSTVPVCGVGISTYGVYVKTLGLMLTALENVCKPPTQSSTELLL